MIEVLKNLTRDGVLEANVANMRASFTPFGYLPGAEVHDGPDLLWTVCDIPLRDFNSVIDARLEREDVGAVIEAAKARCTARGVSMLWHVTPTDRPAGLGRLLNARGFEHLVDVPVMALDLHAMSDPSNDPPDLVVERVPDGKTAREWARTMARAFELPTDAVGPIQNAWERTIQGSDRGRFGLFTGWLDDAAAASAQLTLHGGVAGLYAVATVAEARRRGIGMAMSVAACRRARELGYRIAVLQSSVMGVGIYQRIGFREYGRNSKYVWPPPA